MLVRRAWIIPAVICIGLLAAWPFRWEKGPVQSEGEGKIVHMRDRWTGQAWVALYGVFDGQFVSSEMRPVPSPADIARRKEQILASPEQLQKKQELERQLAEAQKMMTMHDEAHRQYWWFVNQNAKRNEKYFFQGFRGIAVLPLGDKVRYKDLEQGIPQEIIEAQEAWVKAYEQVKNIPGKLYELERQAEITAEAELKYLAWRKRNIATGVWGGLVALSALIAGTLFIRDLRNRQRPQVQG